MKNSEGGTCSLAGPGRGDCENFVGLPGKSIPGQHDGDDDTVDHCGKPNGWCWHCWLMHERNRLQSELCAATSWESLREDKPKEPPTEALLRLATKFGLTDDAEGLRDVETASAAVAWLVRRVISLNSGRKDDLDVLIEAHAAEMGSMRRRAEGAERVAKVAWAWRKLYAMKKMPVGADALVHAVDVWVAGEGSDDG